MSDKFYVGQQLMLKDSVFEKWPRSPWTVVRFFDRMAGRELTVQPAGAGEHYYIEATNPDHTKIEYFFDHEVMPITI